MLEGITTNFNKNANYFKSLFARSKGRKKQCKRKREKECKREKGKSEKDEEKKSKKGRKTEA